MECEFDDDEVSSSLEQQIGEYFQSLVDCTFSMMEGKVLVLIDNHQFSLLEDEDLCSDLELTRLDGNHHYYNYKDLIEIELYRIRLM